MTHTDLAKELKLEKPFIAITRKTVSKETLEDFPVKNGCTLRILNDVMAGKRLVLTEERSSCSGGRSGFGFHDGPSEMPGGIEYFLSRGRGEGYPPGEKLKDSPETAKKMAGAGPHQVLGPHNALEFKPYETGDDPDLVTVLATADQLAAFVNLYTFRTGAWENVIMPMTSGCASIVRIPFGELRNEEPRAVIGNADITARFFFDKDKVFFTVAGTKFSEMLADADDSFIFAPAFAGVKKRL
ncbi:MAG: DUF169 domain-containing protein [Treponema sp.]|jgi:uncharacterized protein (DUF169 family)|nr:DUF169 domain-containing protein [Treponema sp.]